MGQQPPKTSWGPELHGSSQVKTASGHLREVRGRMADPSASKSGLMEEAACPPAPRTPAAP